MYEKIKVLLEQFEFASISLLFGLGSFAYKIKYERLPNNKSNLVHELLFSTMAGYLAYKICLAFNISENMIGIVVGVASYSGTRFIVKMSRIIERHIEIKFNGEISNNDMDLDNGGNRNNGGNIIINQRNNIRPNPNNRSRIIHRN